MLDFCVIGTGISGSTIAKLLNQKFSVNVYDKAKGIGGRSSFKRLNGKIGFDHIFKILNYTTFSIANRTWFSHGHSDLVLNFSKHLLHLANSHFKGVL